VDGSRTALVDDPSLADDPCLEASFHFSTRIACYDRRPYRSRTGEKSMSNVDTLFEQAQVDVRALPEKPGNMTLLRLYALYKQATEGDVHGEKPGFTDMVGKYKYDAWASLEGTAQEVAKQQYVELVESLKNGTAA
jgi:acyl-CoA-binding protein